ncbi:methionine--tRNA ligase [Flavisolibacter tropicus]|uniref:Methionine--tRNA ligase n=1 Tax=Flavisolibacter tropicus TaxID=1492898 RepID=A0A172TTW5_9BACT|nr:methionine--tRNA ligase [Flavisolibacter tropicus]ANE50535.1 methionyl-tRNA synthetase [Flavisolibacter tropicus]
MTTQETTIPGSPSETGGNQPKRYLITSALPYANGQKHIGHLAGAYIPADIYVRYLRAQKRDVVFVCGSDEHGTAIPIQAMKEGTTPQAIIDKYHVIMKENFDDLSISFDIYDRTSNPIHHETAQEFFTYLNDRGELEIKESEQYFDEEAQTFLADRYIKGTCPNCGSDRAFGDQCETCGTSLSPDELINPVSTLSGKPPVKKATKHWYLPLNKHEDWLRNWILNEHQNDWKANVLGQCKSWIDAGLQPRAVTRDLDWGVKVPLPDAEGKVLYVWFDAPIGYISATKQWAINNDKDWKPYWLDKDTKLVHFIGKDNIVFHCIIFPVMLKLHDFIVPANVPANEFMNLEGDKMSTSRNWKLDMQDYIDDFIKKENGGPQMADALRYYLATILPETKDSEFTWKGFQDAVNSELVAIFANYFNRTFVLMHKLTGGKVPKFHNDIADAKDQDLMEEIRKAKTTVENLLEEYKFRDALFEVIDLARKGNKYMQEKEPWIKAKQTTADGVIVPEMQAQIDNCMHICLQLCANLAILINPFLPNTAKKMCHLMKVVDKMLDWENAGSLKLLSVGYSLRAPELLFRKIEDAEVQYQVDKLKAGLEKAKMENSQSSPQSTIDSQQPAEANQKSEIIKSEIQYDDFDKLDLRIGTVISAEKVAKADKLLKLQVDLGFEQRTIVSGIAQHFTPESLVNKQVIVVANLAPRKMRGIESQGMILTAEQPDGKLILVNPDAATINGSNVR